MADSLVMAVAQPLTVFSDVATNAKRHADIVERAGARVVMFPELSLTGYGLDAPVVSPIDKSLGPLVEACEKTHTVALAGAPTRDENGDHISILRFDSHGVTVAYSKMYLGGNEPDRFSPGPAPAVIDIDGWRLGLGICKDTGVPQHAAATAAAGIDAYVAGVCEHHVDAEVQPARARSVATTHGVWVVVASFAGATGGGYRRTAGRSGLWNPDGRVLAQTGPAPDEFVTASLHRDRSSRARPAR